MVTRAAKYLLTTTRGPQRPLQHLETLRHAEWLLRSAQALMIDAARAEGATWADVARARGTTRQAERDAAQRRAAASQVDPFDQWLRAYRERLKRDDQRRAQSVRRRRRHAN
jgi:hypothetical protein